MRIFVITSSYPGSDGRIAGPFIKQLHDHLLDRCSILVLTPHYPGGVFSETLDGVRVIRYPFFIPFRLQVLTREGGLVYNFFSSYSGKLQLPLYFLNQYIFSFFICIWFRPDIIHSQWLLPQGLVGAVCSRIFSIPHISTIHSSEVTIIKKMRFLKWLTRFIIKQTDIIVSVSRHRLFELFSMEMLDSIKNQIKWYIIPNGVNERFYEEINRFPSVGEGNKTLTLLYIGRLQKIKGVNYLIRAIPIICSRYPGISLQIIGSGSDRDELMQLSKQINVNENIHFHGMVKPDDLPRVYHTADIIVFPSITDEHGFTEGLPVVVLEALAAGKPIIATRIPGVCEIIEDEVNGLLVDEKSPEQIADAVIRLIEDESLRMKIQTNARISAQRYRWKDISDQYYTLYQEMIGS